MIERYTRPEMAAVWSEDRKLALWQEIEVLVVEAWADLGVVPAEAAIAVSKAPPVDRAAWKARELETSHDVSAFVDVLGASIPEGGKWVHHGLTSSDVVDTAQAVQMKEASELLVSDIETLFEVVKRRAYEHRDTLMVGRTHGVWAEPTTFGLKLAGWVFELQRHHERMVAAGDRVAVGKLNGAVGTYAHLPPAIEDFVCTRLGLRPEPASTQVTGRDRHAEWLSVIALVATGLERFATEIRNLQRSEIGEVGEAFGGAQKGSSAMPHKRNPIGSENVSGLARLMRAYAAAGLEDVVLWHERDISHSSVERVVLPDASLLLDFALDRMTGIVDGLVINEGRMLANLEASGGTIYSQAVMLALVESGMSRDTAYRLVQGHAGEVVAGGADLQARLEVDPAVTLSADRLARCFDPHLNKAETVWGRLDALEL